MIVQAPWGFSYYGHEMRLSASVPNDIDATDKREIASLLDAAQSALLAEYRRYVRVRGYDQP